MSVTNYKMVSAALGIVALVFVGAFAYAYNAYNNEVSTANQLSSQKQIIQAQLTAAQANITSLIALRTKLQANITLSEATIKSDAATIAKLDANITSLTTQKTQLQAKVTSLNSQMTQLTGQVDDLNTQITSLNSQIAILGSQVSDYQAAVDLQDSNIIMRPTTFIEPAGGCHDVLVLATNQAGYLLITVSSNSSNIYVAVAFDGGCALPIHDETFTTVYLSGTSGTYKVPFAPIGSGVYVFTGNGVASGTVSTTLTITEYT